uniref:Uncharacterized protein n=1 Tax=Odontella aurita TaxID=265563 RepID=A0A6U6G753_9STRA|mmetsp:Transcript_39797/g.119667  ORF Transcript_39797/g.119667 Transcript_39797/m.119667 type:complete len:505 (+) Transcript_39797:1225-2739(+)
MRFHGAALLLALLESSSASEASSVAYVSPKHPEAQHRALQTADIEVLYDGGGASCPDGGTGRRFDADVSVDPGCVTEGGYDLTFLLDVGTITITSCPRDKILKVAGIKSAFPSGFMVGNDLTPGDKNYLLTVQQDLLAQPQVEDKTSVVAMSAKSIELLDDWPQWLNIDFSFDHAADSSYQRSVLVTDSNFPENDPAIYEKPPESVAYSDCYNSLCFAYDHYVMDADSDMHALINLDPPCGGVSDMLVGPTHSPNTCTPVDPPLDSTSLSNEYASGNCMGRCGKGCGTVVSSTLLRQFTNDCLDYDYCTRFNVDRIFANDCYDEFLRTIDDSLWSGNCDIETRLEILPDPCTTPQVTLNPTAAPNAAQPGPGLSPTVPTLAIKPVVITAGSGSCTQACSAPAASGNWECNAESMVEQSFRFEYPNIRHEAHKLGLPCIPVLTDDPLGSNTPRILYEWNTETMEYDFTCVASGDGRGELGVVSGNFDCDAMAGPGEFRMCACYEV